MQNVTEPPFLPSSINRADFSIQLIKEELKSRKFFGTLRDMGLDDCHLQPHLDDLILASVGLTDGTDETYDFYFHLMNTHSRRIGTSAASMVRESLKVYQALSRRAQKY